MMKSHAASHTHIFPLAAGLMVISAAGFLSAGPVLIEAGDLQQLLDTTAIPSADSPDKYRLPSGAELTAFRNALDHVLDGDLPAAADDAVLANYDVVSYTDNISNDVFTLLREKDNDRHWGGLYVVDRTPERSLSVISPLAFRKRSKDAC